MDKKLEDYLASYGTYGGPVETGYKSDYASLASAPSSGFGSYLPVAGNILQGVGALAQIPSAIEGVHEQRQANREEKRRYEAETAHRDKREAVQDRQQGRDNELSSGAYSQNLMDAILNRYGTYNDRIGR